VTIVLSVAAGRCATCSRIATPRGLCCANDNPHSATLGYHSEPSNNGSAVRSRRQIHGRRRGGAATLRVRRSVALAASRSQNAKPTRRMSAAILNCCTNSPFSGRAIAAHHLRRSSTGSDSLRVSLACQALSRGATSRSTMRVRWGSLGSLVSFRHPVSIPRVRARAHNVCV
jgi:hypothetical protein